MGGCQHYEGGICPICEDGTDTCCGDDKICEKCGEEFCRDCYKKNKRCSKTGNFQYPVCRCEIIPDSVIIKFLLKKNALTRNEVKTIIKSEYMKNHVSSSNSSEESSSSSSSESTSEESSSEESSSDEQ
jgi:hypothetical protein